MIPVLDPDTLKFIPFCSNSISKNYSKQPK